MAPRPDSFSFVVFGDNHGSNQVFIDLIGKLDREGRDDLAVNTGDMVNSGRPGDYQKYLELIKKLKLKVYQVPGNHDVAFGGDRYFAKYFGPFYYSFDHKNSHFIVLNNAFQGSFTARQFAWLKNDLAKTDKENIFVFMHRPTFDPSEIFDDYVMSGRETVNKLMELFQKYKVDYVFAGHIHGYARAERDGVVYIVSGGAGGPLHLLREFGGFYNYVRITVDGNKISDKVMRVYE
ncbi:MAG: metallophosphoesterase [Candidatus Margulisbacteria bacterium]|nr:metallophosphoesterase [Candidatus Margulisiibacteriota bacterium]